MAIFNSYIKLPEGIPHQKSANKKKGKFIHKNCGFHLKHIRFPGEMSIQPT